MEKKKKVLGISKLGYILLLPLIFLSGIFVGNKVDIKALKGAHLTSQNSKTTVDYASIDEAYQALTQNYDGKLDATKLLDGLKKG